MAEDLSCHLIEGEEAALVGLGVLLLALATHMHEVPGDQEPVFVETDVVPA